MDNAADIPSQNELKQALEKGTDESKIETLDLTVVVDNSVVEVYANDRFVMSTWVWYVLPIKHTINWGWMFLTDIWFYRSWYSASTKLGFIVEGSEEISFGNVTVYEGLFDAWPER